MSALPRPSVLTGWGRTQPGVALVSHEASVDAIAETVRAAARSSRGVLARGLGRSYGDAASNSGGRVVATDHLTGIGPVDPSSGEVDVAAGTSIGDLLAETVPQGWFVPVTPGTRHVTMGGAVAADVHGKNHHRDGTLGRHVVSVDLVDGGGERRTLRPGDPLLLAVLGGMGLTGIVTRVRLAMRRIESASVTVQTRRTSNLDATMAALTADDVRHRYTVAWVDCLARGAHLGRGVVTSGDHTPVVGHHLARGALTPGRYARGHALPAPPWAPSRLLAPAAVRLFNEARFRRAPAHRADEQQTIGEFFYPLDAIAGWNRLYGRPGFLQYQLAVADPEVVRSVLQLFQRAGAPAYLGVLKRFGAASAAPLSFPRAGWTLAVDFPAVPAVGRVLDAADELVVAAGGRLYLAKDSRLRPELVPVMYPDLDRWRELRDQLDPGHVFVSDLSRRLHL
jgi:decaprenylphospho-beta-D-ribofuranose 2-oxidase